MTPFELVELARVRIDGRTQTRQQFDDATVQRYSEALESCAKLPPLVAFDDGDNLWLADGFHRHAAYAKAGRSHVPVDIRKGTRHDALVWSAGSNDTHGLPRTNEDKRNAVRMLLADEECREWSDRKIADICNVSHPFVGKIRSESTGNVSSCPQKTEENSPSTAVEEEKRVGKDDKERCVKPRVLSAPEPVLVDQDGQPVPPSLHEVFADGSKFKACVASLTRLGNELKQLEATRAYIEADRRSGAINKHYSSEQFTAAKRLQDYAPALVCKACEGRGCGACSNSGWLTSGEQHD